MTDPKEDENQAMKTKAMQKMLSIAKKLQEGTPQIFNEQNGFLLNLITNKKGKNTSLLPVQTEKSKSFRIKQPVKASNTENLSNYFLVYKIIPNF